MYTEIYFVIGEKNKEYPLRVHSYNWALRLALEIRANIYSPYTGLMKTYKEVDNIFNS